jgi:hypothetical protein
MMKFFKMTTTFFFFYLVAISSLALSTLAAPVVAPDATAPAAGGLRGGVKMVPDFVVVGQDERKLYRDTSCCTSCMPYAKGSCPYKCCTTHTPHVGH